MDLPLRDMDDLQPVFAGVVIYVVVLVILRLFLWPAIQDLRKRNFLGRLLHVLGNLMVRLLILGSIIVAGFWALLVLGLDDNLIDFIGGIPDVEVGEINLAIPGVLILLLLLLWFFAIRPALAFFRSRR